MLMPLYFPGHEAPRVVIVGGGYAGLAAMVTIRERLPDAEITLIDPREHHLKITHLHETFRRPLAEMQLSFRRLEERFGIRSLQGSLAFDEDLLELWLEEGSLSLGEEKVGFDYLLWATGAGIKKVDKGEHCLDLSDFTRTSAPELIQQHLDRAETGKPMISVVGSGATGIQFLFELAHYLREHGQPAGLRLVDAGDAPLRQFNPKLGRYVVSRLQDLDIDYVPNHVFEAQTPDRINLKNQDTGEAVELPSALSLLFVGMGGGRRLETNLFGQLKLKGKVQRKIFAAGDAALYPVPGSNALSAQTALRKGRLAGRNILRHSSRLKLLEPYLHRDLGYVIGMGPSDAVGWVGLEGNIVAGQPAALLKEVVESQYDLLLAGMDTYIL